MLLVGLSVTRFGLPQRKLCSEEHGSWVVVPGFPSAYGVSWFILVSGVRPLHRPDVDLLVLMGRAASQARGGRRDAAGRSPSQPLKGSITHGSFKTHIFTYYRRLL